MLCSRPPKFWGIYILDNVKKITPSFQTQHYFCSGTLYLIGVASLTRFMIKEYDVKNLGEDWMEGGAGYYDGFKEVATVTIS